MPENPIMVVNIETGDYTYMHSIDASEAIRLGDYRTANPDEERESSDKKAAAWNRLRNVNVNPPPEMQTPEQRERIRAEAAKEAGQEPAEPLGVRQALGAETTPHAEEHPPSSPPPAPPPPTPHPPASTPTTAPRRGTGG